MTSGLIYAAIAIMWAAVLIPMWLRGHDSTVENKSAERFGQAMRVLSRRDSEDAQGEHVEEEHRAAPREEHREPHREEHREPEPVARADEPRRTTRPVTTPSRRAAVSPRASLAHRRARTLAVLAGLTVLLSLVAVAGPLPLWAPLPVFALLVAFVVHLRNQAKRSEARRASRGRSAAEPVHEDADHLAPAHAPAPAPAPRRSAMARFVPGPSRAMVVETKGVGRVTPSVEPAAGEPLLPATAAAADLGSDDLIDDDESWRPNPLPVPTYVTAPKAVRPIKVIDLTTPGSWSSGRLLDDEGLPEEDLLAADVAADELDGLLEHEAKGANEGRRGRRAVGD